MPVRTGPFDLRPLEERFGARLLRQAPLARYTAARLGGPADAFLEVETLEELVQAVELAWAGGLPLHLLGGGSNVLVSDRGVHGLVVLNRARAAHFDLPADPALPPTLWAESGANFGLLARLAAQRGLAGLEWAAGIPGTLGGAVVGNAGAHGSDMAAMLELAEILQPGPAGEIPASRETWPVTMLQYAYRTSRLKRTPGAVVLSARLRLQRSTPEAVQTRSDELAAYRKRTQPPGASLGSMFKNPPGDYAGRLIEAAGLKGVQLGGAQISPVHANFFINLGSASAADLRGLIDLARERVAAQSGVNLEPEIELMGEW
ncbi:MAG: UDP-N-acetylmuramate dehydrogenase [Chloroflexota bacterium]